MSENLKSNIRKETFYFFNEMWFLSWHLLTFCGIALIFFSFIGITTLNVIGRESKFKIKNFLNELKKLSKGGLLSSAFLRSIILFLMFFLLFFVFICVQAIKRRRVIQLPNPSS